MTRPPSPTLRRWSVDWQLKRPRHTNRAATLGRQVEKSMEASVAKGSRGLLMEAQKSSGEHLQADAMVYTATDEVFSLL
jgi:hypothetical protein